jgi:dethiobiotin synthetase
LTKGIFITGTDTGVGKTLVSAAIIRMLISKGAKTGAMKPVETGCEKRNDALIPHDGMFLKEMAGMDDSIDLITPLRFEHPLAPMTAAELEKRPVEIKKIFDAYEALAKKYEFMVVEGAGGLLAPIAPGYFTADLIKGMKLPLVVAARASLGTINHTLLTVNYALKEGIDVLGVIINSTNPEHGIAEDTNPQVLKRLCPVPVIGAMPYLENISKNNIEEAALKNLDLKALF